MTAEESKLKLYVERGGYESEEAARLLKEAGLEFETITIKGKIRVELFVGEEEWITGLYAIKAWLKERKKRRK